jgi:hypothetical protein
LTFGVLAAVAASSPSSDDVSPGVLGFLVVAAMGVALVFLLKSMNKQFRKIEPKPEGTTRLEGVKGFEGGKGSKPGQSETPAPDAPK